MRPYHSLTESDYWLVKFGLYHSIINTADTTIVATTRSVRRNEKWT